MRGIVKSENKRLSSTDLEAKDMKENIRAIFGYSSKFFYFEYNKGKHLNMNQIFIPFLRFTNCYFTYNEVLSVGDVRYNTSFYY